VIRRPLFYRTKVSYVNLPSCGKNQTVKTVECSTLGVLIENHEVLDLIDIRPKREFSVMHIPGARSLPLAKLASPKIFQRRRESSEPIYIVSDDRGKASLATGILRAAGHTNAMVMEGGMKKWLAMGLPVLSREHCLTVSSLLKVSAGILTIIAGCAFARSSNLFGALVLLAATALFLKATFVSRAVASGS
jgi:rhodanese-related sulfurtransferase